MNNGGKGYRLDKLMAHLNSTHKDELIDDGNRTLLIVGFSRWVAAASDSTLASAAGPYHFLTSPFNRQAIVRSDLPATKPAVAIHRATAKWGHYLDGQQFWRLFRQ